jgi:hypothetical protein
MLLFSFFLFLLFFISIMSLYELAHELNECYDVVKSFALHLDQHEHEDMI